jgi:hypothetical protein
VALTDSEVINKYRQAFKLLISSVGRQIISGKFNLTSVSFPISCMAPTSILQVYSRVTGPMARFFRAASLTDDPVERMKLVMSASISFLEPCHTWAKPLNPVLGETYQAFLADGSELSVEQVTHHPPCSYLLLDGPENSYRYYGFSTFSVRAHINSISLEVAGKK